MINLVLIEFAVPVPDELLPTEIGSWLRISGTHIGMLKSVWLENRKTLQPHGAKTCRVMTDHCTWFPEYWYTWYGKKIYIGHLCKNHDDNCGTHGFYKGTWEARLIGAVAIASIATIACWVKYPSKMIKKVL